MLYGDVHFVENSKLGEIEESIACIGASIRSQKDPQYQEISFEEYSNQQKSGAESDFWFGLDDSERKDRYKTEMKSRADQREVFAGFEEEYKQKLEDKLNGVDLSTVSHFLSERKKTYMDAQSKGVDVLEKIENAAQIEATIYAQGRVRVLEQKGKSK